MHFARYAYHNWLSILEEADPSDRPCVVRVRGVNHVCYMPLEGSHTTRWMRQGQEEKWHASAGQVTIWPADGSDHLLVLQTSQRCRGFAVFLPVMHLLADGVHVEGTHREPLRRVVVDDDTELRTCMFGLSTCLHAVDGHMRDETDGLALRLLQRLHTILGTPSPTRREDGLVLDGLTVRRVVDHVDNHLQAGCSLEEVAVFTGLSPSHFARKFRESVGISLQRFVYRRRIRRSLQLLRDRSRSIPDIASDLGFASRSHFMRPFREITGMTPARYRRQATPRSG